MQKECMCMNSFDEIESRQYPSVAAKKVAVIFQQEILKLT